MTGGEYFSILPSNFSKDGGWNPDGVLEKFKDSEQKVYRTTSLKCSCTFHVEHQAPCRHIIFLRTLDEDCDIFDIDMFNPRYHRVDLTSILYSSSGPINPSDKIHPVYALSDREKFIKQVMPILLKIGNLISSHSTRDFYCYLDYLEDLEKSIRRGQRYRKRNFATCDTTTSELNDNASDDMVPSMVTPGTSIFSTTFDNNLPISPTRFFNKNCIFFQL